MKHNKKRNTAFLYECLVKELTKAIVKEEKTKQNLIKSILKEFFLKGKILKKELELYNSIMETKTSSQDYSQRFLFETKKDYNKLDKKELFNEQTRLISLINKHLGSNVFSNFIPNYKDLATIGMIFQDDNLNAKERIILEDKVHNILQKKEEAITEMRHLDNLEFKMFVNRFNETYDKTLLKEQKELLSNFITSYSDNGLNLKLYVNDEIGRLKDAVDIEIIKSKNSPINENFKKVKQKLDSYAKVALNQEIIEEIFYIQDLLAEVNRNER